MFGIDSSKCHFILIALAMSVVLLAHNRISQRIGSHPTVFPSALRVPIQHRISVMIPASSVIDINRGFTSYATLLFDIAHVKKIDLVLITTD